MDASSDSGSAAKRSVDEELVEGATQSIQAQERLYHLMRTKLEGQPHSDEILSSSSSIMKHMREVKSRLEGTHFSFRPILLNQQKRLDELKHLTVSFTPSTLREDTKVKMAEILGHLFGGQVKKLVYACLLTCPWFAHTQTEVSAQAKANLLYVVFVSSDEQFFSLATPHERQLCETVDEGGFLFATDVRHFCSQLQQGNVRAVEALCAPPESLILCAPQWLSITAILNPVELLQRSFVERCLGQAVGGLVRKRKVKGRLVLREDASLGKFCNAFRLLGYVDCAMRRCPISSWSTSAGNKEEDEEKEKKKEEKKGEEEKEEEKREQETKKEQEEGEMEEGEGESIYSDTQPILQLLHEGFEEGVLHKDALLEHVLKWKEQLETRGGEEEEEEEEEEERGGEEKKRSGGEEEKRRKRLEGLPKRGPKWNRDMERWLAGLRLDGVELSEKPSLPPSDHTKLTDFLTTQGVTSVTPEDVLVVAKSGSHMYGLATPTSDIDYIIVFREPTDKVISSYTYPKESLDNRGQKLDEEMAAYETRMFAEMLLKGAVNIVELVFSDPSDLFYASEEWKYLSSQRELFMSEQVVLQYIGFVQTHMSIIRKKKHTGKPREGKIFYNIFHKLLSLEQFAAGHPPIIQCTGQDKEYIMNIRTNPLEGDLSPENLFSEAQRRLAAVREKLRHRTVRLREYGDYHCLQVWLLQVRGVGLRKPLMMATPPPPVNTDVNN